MREAGENARRSDHLNVLEDTGGGGLVLLAQCPLETAGRQVPCCMLR